LEDGEVELNGNDFVCFDDDDDDDEDDDKVVLEVGDCGEDETDAV
jgi:hypothetical protein